MDPKIQSIGSFGDSAFDDILEKKFEDDHQCWQAFKRGNEAAFIQIYQQYFNVLFNYGYQFTRDKDLIQDSIQDLFIDLRKNRKNLAETNSIKKYLFKSFKRKVLFHLKKYRALENRNLKSEQFEIEFSIEDRIINRQMGEQRAYKIKEAISKLPQRQREAIYYYFYENMNYQEVAEIMQMSQTRSARNLIYKALSSLKINLKVELCSVLFILLLF
jgi:RNA polymerase sigma factor (sigma-70 family)